jgi:hypothetical protein
MMHQLFACKGLLPWQLLVVSVSWTLAGMAQAQTLRGVGSVASLMRPEDMKAIVMEELLGALSPDPQLKSRLQQLEEEIQPLFQALPKNEYGNLGHAAASYLVHRLFLQRHGVVVNGIAPMADAFNSSSVADSLHGRVPSKVQAIFEDRLKGHGLGIHELSILTSTLERLMHRDILSELASVYYDKLNYSTPEHIDRATATEVMSFYLINYGVLPPVGREQWQFLFQKYPAARPQAWARYIDSVEEAIAGQPFTDGFITLDGLTTFGDFLVQRVAREQGERCSRIKTSLSELDIHNTGEVPLQEFYQSVLDGRNRFFLEPVDLLRVLGILKENQDGTISVLTANYLTSPINCNNGSSFHMMCCQSECEPILDRLDSEIANPLATPDQIVRVISSLSSPTLAPSTTVSSELKDRLDSIARQHGGVIALHGRMLAEWLHAVFPRECPYPHSTGTIDPSAAHTSSDDMKFASNYYLEKVVEEQRLAHLAVAKADRLASVEGMGGRQRWSEQEELLAHHEQSQSQGAEAMAGLLSAARYMTCFMAMAAVCVSLPRRLIKVVLEHREQLMPFSKLHKC